MNGICLVFTLTSSRKTVANLHNCNVVGWIEFRDLKLTFLNILISQKPRGKGVEWYVMLSNMLNVTNNTHPVRYYGREPGKRFHSMERKSINAAQFIRSNSIHHLIHRLYLYSFHKTKLHRMSGKWLIYQLLICSLHFQDVRWWGCQYELC